MTVADAKYNKTKDHKKYTLVAPIDLEQKRVLLGLKKRGWGAGKYNGFGGKVESEETVPEAAARELVEESNLLVKTSDLTQYGILLLEALGDPKAPILEIHLFTAKNWNGSEKESDEMKPIWFSPSPDCTDHPQIPYDQMWEETVNWMPPLLNYIFNEEPEKRPARYFIHHVEFVGAKDHEQNYSVWHGMGKSRIEWFDDLPVYQNKTNENINYP